MNWNSMNYSDNEVMRMQQDAMRRVKEMQQLSRDTVAGTNRRMAGDTHPPVHQPPPLIPSQFQPPPVPPSQRQPQHGPSVHMPTRSAPSRTVSSTPSGGGLLSGLAGLGGIGGIGESLTSTISDAISSVSSPVNKIMDALGINGEHLLILMVMFVVFNEQGDKTLLLALGYLLL